MVLTKTSNKKVNPPPLNGEPSSIDSNDDTCHILAHFPYCLLSLHKEKYHAEILEIIKQIRINIPLLDAN